MQIKAIEKSDDVSDNLNTLSALLQHACFTQVMQEAKNRELVVFLGLTGAGKSTCINYLLGAPLKKVKIKGKNWAMLSSKHHRIVLYATQLPEVLEKNSLYLLETQEKQCKTITVHALEEIPKQLSQEESDALKKITNFPEFPTSKENPITITPEVSLMLFQDIISTCGYILLASQEATLLGKHLPRINMENYRSCTLYSQVFNDPVFDLAYCDTPGFKDSRKIEGAREIASLHLQLTLQSARGIKALVLVLDWSLFESSLTTNLEDLMSTLAEFLIGPYDLIENSIIFLINRVPEGMDKVDFTELVMEYEKEVKKNIVYMTDNMSASKIDPSEFLKLNKIALMLNLLQYQLKKRPDNVVLMNVFDHGEKREMIRALLRDKKDLIPQEQFNFKNYDEKRQRFDTELDALAVHGTKLINEYFTLQSQKKDLEQHEGHTQENRIYYAAFTNFIKAKDEAAFSQMKSCLMDLTKKEIERVGLEKEGCSKKIGELQQKNMDLFNEKIDLDKSDSTLIYQDSFHEPVAPKVSDWEWTKFAYRTEKRFIYPFNIRFLSHITTGRGNFESHREDRQRGVLEVTYTSCFGEDAQATFTVFAEKRLVPANATRLMQISTEMPKNLERMTSHQNKIERLVAEEAEEAELRGLLMRTEAITFDMGDHQREEAEKQFRQHFKSNGLCSKKSVILLCNTLPQILDKNTLYLLKTSGNQDQIRITTQMLGENPKILSQEACATLCKIHGFPAFPKPTEKPIKISRVACPELFHQVATFCGYAVMDVEEQKSQAKQKMLLLKEELNRITSAIDNKKNGFALIENLSLLFTPSALTKPFLVLYQDYKTAIMEEAVSQRLYTENCLKTLELFDVDTVINTENFEALENIQAQLEGLAQGVVEQIEAHQKANAFLSLCVSYQKKSMDRDSAIVDTFHQFIEITKNNTSEREEIQKILQKIIFRALCSPPMHEQHLIKILALFIENFGITPDEGNTWLHLVVSSGNLTAVNLLLQNGIDMMSKNTEGQSVFFVAAQKRNVPLLKHLLVHSKIDLKKQVDVLYGQHQKHLFSYLLKPPYTFQLFEIIEALSAFGAKFPLQDPLSEERAFHKLIDVLPFEKSVLDISFFAHADKNSAVFKLLNVLLQNLSAPEKQQCLQMSYQTETLLQFMFRRYPKQLEKIKEIVGYFIAEGAALHPEMLALCIHAQQAGVMAWLLERCQSSLNLDVLLSNRKTLLSLAIESGQLAMIELLLKYKANPNQPSSYDLFEPIENRKGFATVAPDKLRQYLHLPNDFIVGKAVDDGGCFFDAVAQIANSLAGALLHTEKSLREKCYRYYQKNPEQIEAWHQEDYAKGVVVPSYDNVPYSSQESPDGKVVWGRPQVEGMILCRMLGLNAIYVVEVVPNPDNPLELTLGYYAITPNGYESIRKINIPDGAPLLAVSKDDLHFIPVLPPCFVSPLRLCVLKNNIAGLHQIVQAKGNLSDKNALSQTLFHTAALMGHLEMLKVLEQSVSPQNRSEWLLACDHEGNTPLNVSIQYQHALCTQWMIEMGKKYSESHPDKSAYWENVLHQVNRQGETALTVAVKSHNVQAVQSCFLSSHSFWSREAGDKALQLALSDKAMPSNMMEDIKASKIAHCIELVKMHLQNVLRKQTFHGPFLNRWMIQLEKVLREETYQSYRHTLMSTSMSSLQVMAEQLAIGIGHGIREKYHSEVHKISLEKDLQGNIYHAWDYVLRTAIDKTLSKVSEQIQKNTPDKPTSGKSDKHRAFTRALKDALRNYFYVSRALYEGRVLMNAEGLNAFKAACSIASPIITEIGSALTSINIGVIGGFINATLELITRLRDAQYQCEAGRVVQAFGLCQPDAIDKYEKDIPIDHDQLKAVAEALYDRYRDQIEQCTLSKESEISLRLAKTDGIYVLANVMADRIFQHIIKKASVKVEDDRTILKQMSDWFETIGSDNDIYKELSLIALPERCILAVLYECVGEDRDAHIRTDKWLRSHKTEDIWMAGGILVKTGLKIASNPTELYIRKGNEAQESLHAKYGYCYLSDSMVHLKEQACRYAL